MVASRIRLVAVSLLLLAWGGEAWGQAGAPPVVDPVPRAATTDLRRHAFTFRYQSAADAMELVRPLLSPRGSIKLEPGTNTLEVRDSLAALSRIVPLLERFDHPARPVELQVLVLRASAPVVSPQTPISPGLPAELIERLRALLHYEVFELVARADLEPREGEEVTYDGGGNLRLTFRLGTVSPDRQIKLHDFRIVRRRRTAGGRDEELVHTNSISLRLGQTTTLGLARSEDSRSALMVAMTCRTRKAPAKKDTGGRP